MSLLYRNCSGSNLTEKAVSAFSKEVGTRVLDCRINPTEKWQFSGYSWNGLKTGESSVVTLLTEGPPWVFWLIFVLNCIQMHQLVFYSQSYLTGFFFCLHLYYSAVFNDMAHFPPSLPLGLKSDLFLDRFIFLNQELWLYLCASL